MTPQERKVMELALQALESMQNAIYNISGEHIEALNYAVKKANVAEQTITAIKESLAQPEQEPVAWMFQHDETGRMNYVSNDGIHDPTMFLEMNPRYALVCPLYNTPYTKVGWAEKFVVEVATKLQQKQETIEGLNRDYDLLFAEYQLLLKKEWIELTDEEMMDAIYVDDTPMERGRRVEAQLKDKNNNAKT